MYLEWRIPYGAGGDAASTFVTRLANHLEQWSQKWNIAYRTKIHKYNFRMTMDLDQHYDWFMLTWDAEQAAGHINSNWFKFKVVDPMKIDRTQ